MIDNFKNYQFIKSLIVEIQNYLLENKLDKLIIQKYFTYTAIALDQSTSILSDNEISSLDSLNQVLKLLIQFGIETKRTLNG